MVIRSNFLHCFYSMYNAMSFFPLVQGICSCSMTKLDVWLITPTIVTYLMGSSVYESAILSQRHAESSR